MELVDEDFPWNEWMPQLAPHISFCKGSIAEEISPDELQKWGYKSPAQLEDITVLYVRYKGRLHIQQKDADGPYLSSHGGVYPFDIPLWYNVSVLEREWVCLSVLYNLKLSLPMPGGSCHYMNRNMKDPWGYLDTTDSFVSIPVHHPDGTKRALPFRQDALLSTSGIIIFDGHAPSGSDSNSLRHMVK